MTHAGVYLDHNATTALRPEAVAAITAALEVLGNPSSIHRDGRRARALIEDARDAVGALVGARAERVIFTSGGSEANALGLLGSGRRLIVGATEHPCVLRADPAALRIRVDRHGVVDLGHLEALLQAERNPAVVGLMLANNETGVVQPVAEAVALAHAHGALVHCDGVQAPGRMALSLAALGCDSLALSGHKIGGPAGSGALILAEGHEVSPGLRGGGQERGRRAGTENLLGIVGFGASAATLGAQTAAESTRLGALRGRLEAAVTAAVPGVVIYGAGVARLPNTTCVGLPGVGADRQVMALDLAGLRVSAGSACSSGTLSASPVLLAMGVGEDAARQAIRVSLGWTTTEDEVSGFIEAYGAMAARLTA
ncbi:cysteine desulfurase family protein [Rhodospirillum rubrum]|uniref:Cysteine desulfurase n=1 Tax=Rhodospirillum rubrum (strain ATCC 11170 / ATH 1.1.1 / DSM 467 / LMG 4362 / NCIMB 8255 / S1) TaxID=269796 RepID=Q2RSR8_RHORT|nr:cysteine desulfurase family protein [Rhodospirillum rubrum]ABC22827.1 Aminotransferase, class V [Rhodospirillum rubrum ATCC 11170]AEO48551.1 aminotransferase, class V [Rhodospirillum rubrum F11]MBK5954434.1 cysteine desulfurase [Rhodospirillum rubrum]QXG78816.1 cysteine desulfurase [Rhodospirillum rubrum]HCF18893.1 cysteine desulfurase [Rhodospirillum rubrum]